MNASSSEQFEFSCPSCLRPIKAGLKAVGKTLPCPGCGEAITVPTPAETSWDMSSPSTSDDEYALAEPVERTEHTPAFPQSMGEQSFQSEFDNDSNHLSPPNDPSEKKDFHLPTDDDDLLIIERPELPPHPMTTGIFSMFADQSTIVWFISISFAIGIAIGILTLPIMFFSGYLDGGVIGKVFTMLCCGFGAVAGMVALFFTSNCCLCILQDSASGNRVVESWPDKAGGAFSTAGILYILGALFYCMLLGLVFAWPLRNAGVNWILPQIGICFFTFPLFLVSGLEAGSPVIPLSVNIARSFLACILTWLTFYLETAVIWFIGIATPMLLVSWLGPAPTTLGVVLGPLFTFLLFLYFRLLGRLVWVSDEWLRSQEPDEEDEGESDEDSGTL